MSLLFVLFILFLSGKVSASPKILETSKLSVYFKNILSKSTFTVPDANGAVQILDEFNQENEKVANLISRCKRAMIPISFSLLHTPSLCIYLNSIPRRASIPLHTRPGKSFVYILSGSLEVNQAIITDTALTDTQSSIYISHEDAFAESADEDCVCRGGICPRRHGCIFG